MEKEMRTTRRLIFGVAAIAAMQFGCGGHKTFSYSDGQPGNGLVWGGHILFEKIHAADGAMANLGAHTQAHTWFRTPPDGLTAAQIMDSYAYAAPYDHYVPNTCNEVPHHSVSRMDPPGIIEPPDGVTFHDLGPTVTFTPETPDANHGPIVLNKYDAGGNDNNGRHILQFIYGGNKQQGPFPYEATQANTWYDISFQGPEAGYTSDKLNALQKSGAPRMFMPDKFDVISPAIGTDKTVNIQAGQDLEIKFQPLQTADVLDHAPETTFPFIIIAGSIPMKGTHNAFFCSMNDGKVHDHFVVPSSITSQLDDGGIIQMGQLTHVLAEFQGQRVDLLAVSCNTSNFALQK
jgi:hypothetical protein